jgi:hypothetical protein
MRGIASRSICLVRTRLCVGQDRSPVSSGHREEVQSPISPTRLIVLFSSTGWRLIFATRPQPMSVESCSILISPALSPSNHNGQAIRPGRYVWYPYETELGFPFPSSRLVYTPRVLTDEGLLCNGNSLLSQKMKARRPCATTVCHGEGALSSASWSNWPIGALVASPATMLGNASTKKQRWKDTTRNLGRRAL